VEEINQRFWVVQAVVLPRRIVRFQLVATREPGAAAGGRSGSDSTWLLTPCAPPAISCLACPHSDKFFLQLQRSVIQPVARISKSNAHFIIHFASRLLSIAVCTYDHLPTSMLRAPSQSLSSPTRLLPPVYADDINVHQFLSCFKQCIFPHFSRSL
jgi:hypothetical protein